MNCHDARELFSALLDEGLAPEERARLDAHLATCTECSRELDRFRRAVALVQALPPEPAPPGFVDRVTAAARPERWPTRLARRLLVPWTVKLPLEAAALLLVGGLAVLVFRGSEEQQRAARMVPIDAPVERPTPAAPDARGFEERFATRADETADAKRETLTGAQNAGPAGTRPDPLGTYQREATSAPKEPPALAPDAAVQQDPSAVSPPPPAMESPRSAKSDRSKDPAGGALARREAAPALESDMRQQGAPAEVPAGSGGIAPGSEPPARALADRQAAERKSHDSAASEARTRVLSAAQKARDADVRGTLLVTDPQATASAIEAVTGRLRGTVTGARDAGDSVNLQVTVARERYDELMAELGRLGEWQKAAEPSALPPTVRVAVRVAARSAR